jgi:hypothetical protein
MGDILGSGEISLTLGRRLRAKEGAYARASVTQLLISVHIFVGMDLIIAGKRNLENG